MGSVARGLSPAPVHALRAAAAGPARVPARGAGSAGGARAAPGAADRAPLPPGLEQQRGRALAALGDVVRLALTALVGGVAHRLCRRPAAVTLAGLEVELRDALLALGATLLEELVRPRGTGACGPSYVCPCGVRLVLKEVAPLQQRTWFGPITLERAVYAGAGCRVRAHHVPLDAAWGRLGATAAGGAAALPEPDGGTLAAVAPGAGPARLAPAFAAVVVEFGARLPYAEAARLLALALGPVARLAPNTIKAYTQAAGRARQEQEDAVVARRRRLTRGELRAQAAQVAPPRAAAAPDVLAIHVDGALERTTDGWKEVKLGATCDLVPARAPGAAGAAPAAPLAVGRTTYTATLAPAAAFGRRLRAAAERRGLRWAGQVAVLGDGAKWIWKLAGRYFPQAVQVVDWYHAREHLWQLAQLLYGEGTAAAWTWLETLAGVLWAAQATEDVTLLAQAADEAWAAPRKDLPAGVPRRTRARRRAVEQAVAYFTANAPRLRYGAFRAQGLPVGSGVVEGGCRSVLHVRLKRPGARWTVAAAEAMVRARAALCSDPTPDCSHPEDRFAA